MTSELKFMFGKPFEGNHAERLVFPWGGPNVALIDLALTFLGALAWTYWRASKKGHRFSAEKTMKNFLMLWGIGILMHYSLGLNTGLIAWARKSSLLFVATYTAAFVFFTVSIGIIIDGFF